MTLQFTRHHLIELIKEDIKLNYLVFALKDIGIECHPELLNLSQIIFSICEVDMEKDLRKIEAYYHSMNQHRSKSFEMISEELHGLSEQIMFELFEIE